MKIDALIEKIDWFQKFAQENLDIAIETKNLSPQERQRIYTQRHREKIKQEKLQNPNDPRWEKERSKRKEDYDLYVEYLNSNTEELNRQRDLDLERYRRWREKQNPEILKQRRNERAIQEAAKIKTLKESGSLDGLLLMLGQQVASRKKDLKKYNKLTELEIFSNIATGVNNLRFNIREYLDGIRQAPGSAGPKTLFHMIEQSNKYLAILSKYSPAMTNTMTKIITKLQELADNYTASS